MRLLSEYGYARRRNVDLTTYRLIASSKKESKKFQFWRTSLRCLVSVLHLALAFWLVRSGNGAKIRVRREMRLAFELFLSRPC